jgi:iron complex outermembrane recepter protein
MSMATHHFARTGSKRLAQAIGLALVGAVVPALAQDAAGAPGELEEIVVTGFRASLELAQDIKRQAPNTLESVVAEDIAKMPDLNLAESIQRIPGVAMTREGGEGRNITLRGFAPDFTRTTLNGMEVPATSDGLDSGGVTINAGRAFDFHLFASELFNRIDVQKTQTASLEEGGIAGTVDLHSAKPFDYDGLTMIGSAQGAYNTLNQEVDPRVAMLFSNTFLDDKFGVLFSAAWSERTVRQEGYSSVRWTSPHENGDSWADTNPTVTGTPDGSCGAADPLDCLWAPRLPRADFFGNDQERLGLSGSIQFKPTDDALLTLDVLHSELDNDRYSYNSMEWLLTHGPAGNFTGQTPLDFVIGKDGKKLIAASFDDVTSWYESRHQESESKFDQIVFSGSYDIADNMKLDGLIGNAKVDADRTELRFYYRSVPHFYSYDFRKNPDVAQLDFGGYDPNDPANYVDALVAANRLNKVEKDNTSAKVNFTLGDNDFNFKTGLAWSDRTVDYSEGTGQNSTVDPQVYWKKFPYSDFGRGIGAPGLDPFLVADFGAIRSDGLFPRQYTDNAAAGWKVGEETMGGYVELNGRVPVGSMTLRVNTGVRFVQTDVTSQAVILGTPTKVTSDYDNYLPSLNLALDVTDDVIVRFAYGRSMTRPGLASLNIAAPVFTYETREVGNLGNPGLKPYESNDIDLGVEWYTEGGGLVAVQLFNKDVIRSIQVLPVEMMVPPEYWDAIYNDPRYDPSYNSDPAEVPYTFYIPQNNDKGNTVTGYELIFNQPFTFFDGWASNFGIATNYTHVSADDDTGLSPDSYNFTVYYETQRYGARVSVNNRDDYLLSEPGGNGHVQERKYGPTHVDLSTYWNFNEHLTFTFEGINVTDEIERIYGTGDTNDMHLTREYTHTGAQWLLGARYSF